MGKIPWVTIGGTILAVKLLSNGNRSGTAEMNDAQKQLHEETAGATKELDSQLPDDQTPDNLVYVIRNGTNEQALAVAEEFITALEDKGSNAIKAMAETPTQNLLETMKAFSDLGVKEVYTYMETYMKLIVVWRETFAPITAIASSLVDSASSQLESAIDKSLVPTKMMLIKNVDTTNTAWETLTTKTVNSTDATGIGNFGSWSLLGNRRVKKSTTTVHDWGNTTNRKVTFVPEYFDYQPDPTRLAIALKAAGGTFSLGMEMLSATMEAVPLMSSLIKK